MACGVIGIVMKEGRQGLRDYARDGMVVLNHRGEESHGIAMLTPDGRIEGRRERGLVRDSGVFDDGVTGSFFLGHTRYTTSSSSGDLKNTQPVVGGRKLPTPYAISHNGDITNTDELRGLLGITKPMSDTRVMARLLKEMLRKGGDPVEAVRDTMLMCQGSYSMAVLLGGENPMVVAIRDRYGYMPLCVGWNEDGYFVASESAAFGNKYFGAGYTELKRGHIAVLTQDGVESSMFASAEHAQHCWFQWVYMAKPNSKIAGISVYGVRERIGRELAAHYRPEVDLVSPIPDSGRVFALGYTNATDIPIVEALMRDRYEARRSFMQDGDASRISVARKKLDVMGEDLRGKRLLIIDDSLVRGHTTREVIAQLRDTGVSEVHVGIASPPIRHQCMYGLDFYKEELIADGRSVKEIAGMIGADSVYYLSHDGLASAIGLPKTEICEACINGRYQQEVVLREREWKRA